MRIRSARIASYGRFHDRSFGFSEGIAVYHG